MTEMTEETRHAIDTLAAILRATYALERARDVGVQSMDLCMASLREQGRAVQEGLGAWVEEILSDQWGVAVGDQVSLSTDTAQVEGQLRAARISLRLQDYAAYPQIALTIESADGGKECRIDAIGPSARAVKLANLRPAGTPTELRLAA